MTKEIMSQEAATQTRKYRVLVVDDEPSVLLTYRMILEKEGYEVVACGTWREGLSAVAKRRFDVVLCDYSLEERHTGFEVISAARELDAGVPAALLTGYATQETTEEAAARSIGVMFKPIEIDEFLATTLNMARRVNGSKEEIGEKKERAQTDGHQSARRQRR
ncbi:MAG TPA: response regulator [Verrucomicrobiae bacterium]|nr:response regulator [Verrucomicrobiae bacterium]